MHKLALAIILCVAVGLAQGTSTSSPTIGPVDTNIGGNFQPALYIGAGGTYNSPGGGFAAETEVGVRIGNTPLYSYTTLEFAPLRGTVRTGSAFVVFQRGNISMLTLADAGIATGSTTLGSFSGGGMGMYDIGNRFSRGHFYIGLGARLISTTSLGSQVVAVLTFGHGI
jgi:hypothetical protein